MPISSAERAIIGAKAYPPRFTIIEWIGQEARTFRDATVGFPLNKARHVFARFSPP